MNIDRIRKIAGLSTIAESKKAAQQALNESFHDDDDDMSPAERELASKADKDLKKKGVKIGKIDPDKDMADAAKKEVASKAEHKPEEKKEEPPKAETKSEEAPKEKDAAEAKRRGKAPNPDSKMQKAKAWIVANPHAKRGEFLKHAESFAMSKNYGSAFFYAVKRALGSKGKEEVKECFFLTHPQSANFVLAENREMNQFQWIDASSDLEPLVFVSEAEARKMMVTIYDFKRQASVLTKVDVSGDE